MFNFLFSAFPWCLCALVVKICLDLRRTVFECCTAMCGRGTLNRISIVRFSGDMTSADPAAAEDAVGFVEHDGLAGGDAELGFGEVHVQAVAVDGDFGFR